MSKANEIIGRERNFGNEFTVRFLNSAELKINVGFFKLNILPHVREI